MDEIKKISIIDFNGIASVHPFRRELLVKDYYITLILYLIKDIQGIYLKGGTALNKMFLNHARLSEDIDFTLNRNEKEVKEEISNILALSGLFRNATEGKDVDGFIRITAAYKSDLGEDNIFLDLNKKAKLTLPSEIHKVNHFYAPFIPEFSFRTIAKEELIAEKVRATITRNKPRDHFDVFKIIHANMSINIKLAEEKCKEVGSHFSVIKMFNKAKTLKNRWDKDMVNLLAEPLSFQEIIQFLARYFKLKEAKETLNK